jgi:bifunctional DNA-binding transcriptional regulator/antitoxin component of YhaV-PrlF toxin-antitoxin module
MLVARRVMNYGDPMTTTVSVSPKGQMELPEEFRKRKKIKPGTALRVTEVGDGLYVTPLSELTEKELRKSLPPPVRPGARETSEDEKLVQRVIAEYRQEKRWQRR